MKISDKLAKVLADMVYAIYEEEIALDDPKETYEQIIAMIESK